MSPEKTGKKPFTHVDPLKQIHSRQVDDLAIEAQERHIGHTYVPKKAGTSEIQPGVNQLQSTLETVLKIEEAKKFKTDNDVSATFKPALRQQNPKER